MYLSRTNKFLYIAVPRTASNTTQALLTKLVPPTSDDLVFRLYPKNPPYTKAELLHYHATPAFLVENGWLQASDFEEYKSFGFIRNPIERWVSHFFLSRSTGRLLSDKENVALMKDVLDDVVVWPVPKRPAGSSVRKLLPGPVQHTAHRITDFFCLEEEQVIDAYHWEDFKEVVGEVTGKIVTETEWVDLNVRGIPDEFRRPVEEWLPSEYVSKLRERLRHEFEFYDKHQR